MYTKSDSKSMEIQFFTNSSLMMANLESAFKLKWRAPIYKNKLMNVVQNGMKEQIKSDKFDENIVARIEYIRGLNVLAEVQKAMENASKCHEKEIDFEEYATDDVSGEPLDRKMVRKARMEEVDYIRKSNLNTNFQFA